MSGTRAGGLKAAAANKARNPHFYRDIAYLAQEKWIENGRKPRGFATNPELARYAGAKGGRVSRRPSKKLVTEGGQWWHSKI